MYCYLKTGNHSNKHSKKMHYLWKQAGRPEGNHPTRIARKKANREVRRVQRTQDAINRNTLLADISAASENDQRLFHKLVRKQRAQCNGCSALIVDGQMITDEDSVRSEWARYYQKLSTPEHISDDRAQIVEYMRILSSLDPTEVLITVDVMEEAIRKLNSNKAADRQENAAEQFKMLPHRSIEILTELIQKIVTERKLPDITKRTYKIPIPKKDKDPRIQDNHRGITIAPILCKIVELICMKLGIEQDLPGNDLQFGFTIGRSPSMASLIITEALAEAKRTKSMLIVATLDARKAFDVVNHELLKSKLFTTNLKRPLWTLVDDMYMGGNEVIRWKGTYSEPYEVRQGVKQGGVLSPSLYKLYIFDLLRSLRSAGLGVHIGHLYLGTPSCADDVLLLSNLPSEMQAMLNINSEYSKRHKYEIHPTKSTVTPLYQPKSKQTTQEEWNLAGNSVPIEPQFTHLGLEWKTGRARPNISKCVTAARRTAYSLLGAGLHGRNGLDPMTSMRVITLYVVPRLLHGLEATVLQKSDINELDKFFKKLLRQIQHLPESTATEAIYLMLGALPIEAEIHARMLSLFGNITRLKSGDALKELARRQLAMSSSNPDSWFTHLEEIATTYEIDLHQALQMPWPKNSWKSFCKNVVKCHWSNKMLTNASQKSTLKHIVWNNWIEQAHGVWRVCRERPFLTEAASTRARILVSRINIQASSWKKHKGEDPRCPMCEEEEEDIQHLLVSCPATHAIREERIPEIRDLYKAEEKRPPRSQSEVCSAIINGGSYVMNEETTNGGSQPSQFNRLIHLRNDTEAHILCNLLCHRIYKERDIKINEKLMNKYW